MLENLTSTECRKTVFDWLSTMEPIGGEQCPHCGETEFDRYAP